MTDVNAVITLVHREEWARVVATLARRFGDLDIAEEMAAEAFATAVERWPSDGVPANPGAWLTTTGHRKGIDRLRRESRRDEKHKEALMLSDTDEPIGAIDDDRLRLVFTCCHPALATETRVALTLRMVGGLTVPEIANAFLVQEAAMGRRITRAKEKIKAAKIPYRVPLPEDLPRPGHRSARRPVPDLQRGVPRLESRNHCDPRRSHGGSHSVDPAGRCPAAGPTARSTGLLALMLLTEARRTARVSAGGDLVALDEQDRGAWDRALIAEGHALVRARLTSGEAPGRYQILAAINAVHTDAPRRV